MQSGEVLGSQAETENSKEKPRSLFGKRTPLPYEPISVFFGGQAETAKSKQKYPLALISLKTGGMLVKSCSLEGFWAVRLKSRRGSKSIHWLQYHSKVKDCR